MYIPDERDMRYDHENYVDAVKEAETLSRKKNGRIIHSCVEKNLHLDKMMEDTTSFSVVLVETTLAQYVVKFRSDSRLVDGPAPSLFFIDNVEVYRRKPSIFKRYEGSSNPRDKAWDRRGLTRSRISSVLVVGNPMLTGQLYENRLRKCGNILNITLL